MGPQRATLELATKQQRCDIKSLKENGAETFTAVFPGNFFLFSLVFFAFPVMSILRWLRVVSVLCSVHVTAVWPVRLREVPGADSPPLGGSGRGLRAGRLPPPPTPRRIRKQAGRHAVLARRGLPVQPSRGNYCVPGRGVNHSLTAPLSRRMPSL